MGRLGYSKFAAHGGDWGGNITTVLGGRFPAHVLGIHTTFAEAPPGLTTDGLTAVERKWTEETRDFWRHRAAYAKQQATRPQTIGYSLVDSPVGLLAWILDKFAEWTDTEDSPFETISRDSVLDDVTLYWLTRTGASSARIYYESHNSLDPELRVDVPSAITYVSPRHREVSAPPGHRSGTDRSSDGGRPKPGDISRRWRFPSISSRICKKASRQCWPLIGETRLGTGTRSPPDPAQALSESRRENPRSAAGAAVGDGLFHQCLPEVPHQAAATVRVVHDGGEGLHETVHLLLTDDQRRNQLDDLQMVAGDLGEDAVLAAAAARRPSARTGPCAPPAASSSGCAASATPACRTRCRSSARGRARRAAARSGRPARRAGHCSSSPVRRALATTARPPSPTSTASPAAMAWALEPKLAECTSTRSIDE